MWLLQMGGTIDNDMPLATQGYAFEVADPAVDRVLRQLACGFTHDVMSVARKDSMDLNQQDRTMLVEVGRSAVQCSVAVHCLLPCIACCSVLMLTLTLTILVGHPKIESYQTDSNTRHGYYHRDSAVCGQRAPSYQ
jgi:hypothetical protein